MLFETSAVKTSLPVLKPMTSILTPLAYWGSSASGVQCAHFAYPSLMVGSAWAAAGTQLRVSAASEAMPVTRPIKFFMRNSERGHEVARLLQLPCQIACGMQDMFFAI